MIDNLITRINNDIKIIILENYNFEIIWLKHINISEEDILLMRAIVDRKTVNI